MLKRLWSSLKGALHGQSQPAMSLEDQVGSLSRAWGVKYPEAWRIVKRYSYLHRLWMHTAAAALEGLTYEEALQEIGERR